MDHYFGIGHNWLVNVEAEVTRPSMNALNVILGFGITGQSVARFLLERGETPVVLDTRAEKSVHGEFANLEIYWGCTNWPQQVLQQAGTVIVSPGLPLNTCLLEQARASDLSVISDIDLFFQQISKPVIGVTGTNGKSTVVSLVGHILNSSGYNCAIGGNLGEAALDLVGDDRDFYVLELSSFQLEHSNNLPLARSAILNITEDHLDHHGSLEKYIDAKQKILAGAQSWVFNREDINTRSLKQVSGLSYGFDSPTNADTWGLIDRNQQEWIFKGDVAICSVAELPLQGRHNLLNCMAAMALAEPFVDLAAMPALVRNFQELTHRFQTVAEIAGITFVNDSKATNVGSTKAALDGLEKSNNIVLIAGGDAKGADLEPLADSFGGRVKRVVTLGKDGSKVAAVANACGIAHVEAASIESAVLEAVKGVAKGDLVLLSPACSSLDMYDSFQQRGDIFASSVRSLTAADLLELQT